MAARSLPISASSRIRPASLTKRWQDRRRRFHQRWPETIAQLLRLPGGPIQQRRNPRHTFRKRWVLTTDFGKQDKAAALALQPDGKIVVVGFSGEISRSLDRGISHSFTSARVPFQPANTPPPRDFALSFSGTAAALRASKLRLQSMCTARMGSQTVSPFPRPTRALKILAKRDSVSTVTSSVDFVLKIKKSAPR
jgi:hypothetical protein